MDNTNYIEWIERYTLGHLNKTERKEFESELSSNKKLKEFYNLYNLSLDAIETDIEKDLRNDLQSWEKESSTQKVNSKSEAKVVPFRRKMFQWAAAASFLLLAGFFGMNYFNPASPTNSPYVEYYGDYYKPATLSTFRDSNPTDVTWQANLIKIEEGKFDDALVYLNSLDASNERYAEAQYLAGHTNLQSDRYDDAKKNFKNTITAGQKTKTRFTDKAEWNYLLTFLKEEKINPEFTTLLNQIAANQKHSFNNEANELVKRLKENARISK